MWVCDKNLKSLKSKLKNIRFARTLFGSKGCFLRLARAIKIQLGNLLC